MQNHNSMYAALVLACLLLVGCEQSAYQTLQGRTMGTTWSVKYEGRAPGALQADIEQELVRINALMSTYDDDSELSRFNASEVGEPVTVSADLIAVLQMSREIHQVSKGAFEITIGPLVNLWGFGPDASRDVVPSDAAIAAAMSRVGENALQISGTSLTRSKPVYVDLSAIAKGYAVDRLAALLVDQGVTNYLVEIGGELKAGGRNPQGNWWRIAIEKPDANLRSIQTTMALAGLAMATSGDYRNYFEADGVRYSHMIDPRTGRPITHNVASVTVLHEQSAMADGFATALSVMGEEEAIALAEAHQLRVLIIIKSDGGFSERTSSAMNAYLQSLDGS